MEDGQKALMSSCALSQRNLRLMILYPLSFFLSPWTFDLDKSAHALPIDDNYDHKKYI